MHTKRAYWGVLAMAEFSRNRFFSSFSSGQMTFGVSTTELSRIYHGELGMSIQHETEEKHVLKAKTAYVKTKNERKRYDGKEVNLAPDFVKKQTKEAPSYSRTLRTNIRHRKTEKPRKIQGISWPVLYDIQFKKIRFFCGMR